CSSRGCSWQPGQRQPPEAGLADAWKSRAWRCTTIRECVPTWRADKSTQEPQTTHPRGSTVGRGAASFARRDHVVEEGGERKMGTNKCLFKQLLCLYPFPHFSQRSSGRLL